MPPVAFYFDLASPLAYLAAERVLQVLPGPAEWQPVLASELRAVADGGGHHAEVADGRGRPAAVPDGYALREDIAERARQLGLQPLRWPEPFPFDSALAMRVATYAKSIGRAVPFAQAAFRQAFAGGRSLADPDNVLIAAAACEMHPAAVLRGAELRSVGERLAAATARAAAAGITDVPAVLVGERPFVGERALERAAEHMGLAADATAVERMGAAERTSGAARARTP